MQIVTVRGGNGVTIAIPFSSSDNAAVAAQLLQNLYYADPQSVHIADASTGIQFDGAVPGDVNEFVDNISGQTDLPSGYQYLIGDYVTAGSGGDPANSFVASGDLDNAVISAGASSLTFQAGTGNATIVAGGNIVVTTRVSGGGGGAVYLDGSGNETLTLSSGNWTVTTGTGIGHITLGAGSDAVIALGTDTIVAGTGPAVVTMDHGQDLFDGGSATATVVDNGADDTIAAGAGRESVFAQGSALRVQGGSAEVLFVDVTGHNSFTAGSGGGVVFGSAVGSTYQTGGSYFFLINGGGNDTINAPTGAVGPIVFGSPDGRVKIEGNGAGTFVVAGSGNETVDASGVASGVVFFGGTGNADFLGGKGSNFYAASTGNTTMSGGVGNVYEFISGHEGAVNVITDFTQSDQLYLAEFGTATGDGIVKEIVTNGTLDLTLADGTLIIFENLSSASQLTGHIHNI